MTTAVMIATRIIVPAFCIWKIDHVSPLKLSVRGGLTNARALPQALFRLLNRAFTLGR